MRKQRTIPWSDRITVSDAAWFLGVSRQMVKKLIQTGYLKIDGDVLDKKEVKKLASKVILGISHARGTRQYFLLDEKGVAHPISAY